MAVDFEQHRKIASQRQNPINSTGYTATREEAAAELDTLITKYVDPDNFRDIAVMMAGVIALDPHFYDDD